MEKTTFEKLSAINMNDKVEKKNGLTYLSWALAWGETKKACPDATYKIKETEYDDALGFMCHTEVTIQGETLEMWLPVMDGANKSMKKTSYTYATRYGEKSVEAATSFDINKTIMRCLVKNLAMFGLGIYIYAGEDLPESETPAAAPIQTTKPVPAAALEDLKKDTESWSKVVKYVEANKALGSDKICQQLGRKYKLTAAIKKEINAIISAQ
jgi:hypothetical protein